MRINTKKLSGKIVFFLACINIFAIIFTVPAFARGNYEAGATYSIGGGTSTEKVTTGSLVPLSTAWKEGTETAVAETWKVTLFVGKNNTVRLTDKATSSNYNKCTIIYSARGINTMNKGSGCHIYLGNADKISYRNGWENFSPVKVKAGTENPGYVGNQKFIVRSSVPKLKYGTEQEKHSADAINYFLTDNRSTILNDFKAEYGVSVSDNVPWCLILEPVLRTYIDSEENVYLLYTATEYAYSQSSSTNSGGYYDYCHEHMLEPYTFYNLPNYYRLTEGWLGLPSGSRSSYSWLDIPTDKLFRTRGSQERRDAEDYIKNHWDTIKQSIINYGGCAMYCSPYFDNSDYTLSTETLNMEKFENETVTLKVTVNRTTPEKDGAVDVTLYYNAPGSSIDQTEEKSVTKSVSFSKGQTKKELRWSIQVGTYGDTSTDRDYKYTLTIKPREGTTDIDTTNNVLEGNIRLKRDFQVTSVSLNKKECFENENVKVTFAVKNANRYRDYSNVPVSVYFLFGGDEVKIGTVIIETLGANETKRGSCTVNVGCVTDNADQKDAVVVTVNSSGSAASSGERYTEPDMSNNRGSVNIRVKRDINLSVSIVYGDEWGNPIENAPSKVKNTGSTQIVTTCAVTNHSRFNLYSDDLMNDIVTVTLYAGDKKIGSKTVDIPRYGSNLVWFKWNLPEGTSVSLRAELTWNVDQESAPSPYYDNRATKYLRLETVREYETPDPDAKKQREYGANSSYSNAYAYNRVTPSIAKWSEWVCDEKGVFTRIDYAMTGDAALTLTPEKFLNNSSKTTIYAGAGFEAVFSYTVRTECSEAGYDVSENDYTYAQNVVATFPEFNYTVKGDCRTMYLVKEDGDLSKATFRLEKNVYDNQRENVKNRRLHFTPYNMPDGEYKVGVVASQMWTPAGPINVNASSSLLVDGVLTDEYITGGVVKQG